MRQSVARLGATIDTATPDEVEAILHRVLADQYIDQYERKKVVIQLDGTGAGTTVGNEAALDLAVSSEFDWLLDRVTIGGSGAPSAIVTLYENDATSDTNMLEVIGMGTAGKYSDSFSNCIYVPSNSRIVITVTGGVVNGQVMVGMQIKLKKHARMVGEMGRKR